MAVNFSVWTGLQAGDPNPARWILIYGAAAIASAVLPGRMFGAALAAAAGAVSLVWAAYLVRQVWGVVSISDLVGNTNDKNVAVLVVRQGAGLLIAGIWLLFGATFRFVRS
ncbi:MAG: hypothetical protein JWO36_6497 [Myxococcales bacterium]|jgi:hypothetical protein|nr:hypothetical protein [Myxococcales bacterium]